MVVLTVSCVFLSTDAGVTPGEANLMVTVFVSAGTFAFVYPGIPSNVGHVVFESCVTLLQLLLSSEPFFDELPQSFVGSFRICRRLLVPKEVLDIELMGLSQVGVELKSEDFQEMIV